MNEFILVLLFDLAFLEVEIASLDISIDSLKKQKKLLIMNI